MAAHNFPVYDAEYLATTYGELNPDKEQIVIVTIRPAEDSFCPVNFAFA